MRIPEPPSPPDFVTPPTAEATSEASSSVPIDGASPAGDPPPKKSTESIGISQVIQAFLLRLQELGLATVSGTDGNDKLNGWSGSLVDAGDGNDTVNVWSGSVVDAGAGSDTVKAWSESRVHGGAGDDRIEVWSDSQVDGGDGADVIRAWSNSIVAGGAGNDDISGWSGSQIDGGEGDDVISVWSDSIASGGAGNDTIYAAGGAIVAGGTGDDTISVGGDSTISFAAGDGKDSIFADINTRLELGGGISRDKTHVTVSGHTATITFDGSDDQITLNLDPRGPATLAFADGSTMEVRAESRLPGA
jgi:hypothetical protein